MEAETRFQVGIMTSEYLGIVSIIVETERLNECSPQSDGEQLRGVKHDVVNVGNMIM